MNGIDTVVPLRRVRKKREFVCHFCRKQVPYAWNCKCGFMICPDCMEENKPLMSNNVIWICPDCGEIRSF